MKNCFLNGKHRKNQLVLRPESAAQEQLLLEFKIWLLAWSLWTHMNVDAGAAPSSGPGGLPGSGWIPSLLREHDPGKHPELARPVISMHFFFSLRSDLELKKWRQVILILCTNTCIFTESSYYAVVSNQKEEGEQKGYLISFPPWRRERVAQNNREEKIRLFWAEKCKTKG